MPAGYLFKFSRLFDQVFRASRVGQPDQHFKISRHLYATLEPTDSLSSQPDPLRKTRLRFTIGLPDLPDYQT
jgi:hypothetical protein